MAIPGRFGNVPSDETVIEAYEMRCQGMSYRAIATAMAGDPHHCGGYSTARRWVALGLALATRDEDEDGNGRYDPLRKRRARREMAIDEFDRLRARLEADRAAGEFKLDPGAYYNQQTKMLLAQAQLGAWHAPRALPKVKDPVTGEKRAVVPADLFASLTGMSREELDAAIEQRLDDMLPDERNQP